MQYLHATASITPVFDGWQHAFIHQICLPSYIIITSAQVNAW